VALAILCFFPMAIPPGGASSPRRTADLRIGRESIPGATYFATFCAARRAPLLDSDTARAAGHDACRALERDGDAAVLAATIMPEHVHLLLRLGARLPLDRVIAKWKSQVRRACPGLVWQANYFEHRLRSRESSEPYAWYVFMNPYRARLVDLGDCWRGWWSGSQCAWGFLDRARPGPCPQPEWMEEVEVTARSLTTGEP